MERYKISEYREPQGRQPFRDWIRTLDSSFQARIQKRIKRMQTGALGDHRHLERSLYEARFHFGPGYRVYFGIHQDRLILLLGGGDKASQVEDIFTALQRWADYKESEA